MNTPDLTKPVDLSEAYIEDMVAIGHPPAHLNEEQRRYWYWLATELSKLKRQ